MTEQGDSNLENILQGNGPESLFNNNVLANQDKNVSEADNLFSDLSSDNNRRSNSHSSSPSHSNSQSNNVKRKRARSRSNSGHKSARSDFSRSNSQDKSFVMKNGCCRDCMKAFSKSGKSCLCQVPKDERKYVLSDKGCNFCSCHGCNPADVRKDKRKEMKRQLRDDKNILYKKQRLIDSDDEEVKVFDASDEWNTKRKELYDLLASVGLKFPNFAGVGVPMRRASYILGYQPKSETNKEQPEKQRRRSDNNHNNGYRKEHRHFSNDRKS